MTLKVLMLCHFDRSSANTIIDHATSFKKFSRHNYSYLDPWGKNRPGWLNLNVFDAIVIHYSVYLLYRRYLNDTWRARIAEARGARVLFIQDEYQNVNAFINAMRELKIDVLFTCYPEPEIEKVYSPEKLPGVVKVNTLTGYVPDYLEHGLPSLSGRPVDVGYRARGTGFWWLGELYQEKWRIGVEFLKHVRGKAIKCDISNEERDRIYGTKWIEFLKTCRCFLGTESGASVVDFTGEIEKRVQEYCAGHPMATFAEVKELFFKDVDGLIRMNQISPRVFESIGCGCCPVLFEGEYSGILRPEEHYIPIKKDFSNIDEVIDKILDQDLVTGTVRMAYDEVIASDKYSYRSFVESVDRTIEEFISSKIDTPSPLPTTMHQSGQNQTKLYWLPWWFRCGISIAHSRALRGYGRLQTLARLHPFLVKEKFWLVFSSIRRLIQ